MVRTRYAALAWFVVLGLVNCSRPAPSPALDPRQSRDAGGLIERVAENSAADSAVAPAPSAATTSLTPRVSLPPAPSTPATDLREAGTVDPSEQTLSLKMLRDLADGHKDVHGVLDLEQGVAIVWVGPNYDPKLGSSTEIKTAKKLCGTKIASSVAREIRLALVDVGSTDQLVCKGLSCVHHASGEWDSQVRLEFARKDGRLILVAIEHVLDVPMRDGADKDIEWAAKQRTRLVKERCP